MSYDSVWTQLLWQMLWPQFIVLAIVCHLWQMFCHWIIMLPDAMSNMGVGMPTVAALFKQNSSRLIMLLMLIVVVWRSSLSCSNFFLSILMADSTGTDVKSALTSYELMHSSSCCLMSLIFCTPWCSGHDMVSCVPWVLITQQVPLLALYVTIPCWRLSASGEPLFYGSWGTYWFGGIWLQWYMSLSVWSWIASSALILFSRLICLSYCLVVGCAGMVL